LGRENIFKPTIGIESLRQDSKNCQMKNSSIQSMMFPHRNVHEYT